MSGGSELKSFSIRKHLDLWDRGFCALSGFFLNCLGVYLFENRGGGMALCLPFQQVGPFQQSSSSKVK